MGKRKQTGESLLPISINSLWLEHGLQWTSLAPPMVHIQTNDWNVQTNQLSFHQYKVCSYYSVSRHILTSFPSGTNNKRPNTRQKRTTTSITERTNASDRSHTYFHTCCLPYVQPRWQELSSRGNQEATAKGTNPRRRHHSLPRLLRTLCVAVKQVRTAPLAGIALIMHGVNPL